MSQGISGRLHQQRFRSPQPFHHSVTGIGKGMFRWEAYFAAEYRSSRAFGTYCATKNAAVSAPAPPKLSLE
jgi:hypothetical protein